MDRETTYATDSKQWSLTDPPQTGASHCLSPRLLFLGHSCLKFTLICITKFADKKVGSSDSDQESSRGFMHHINLVL